MTKLMTDTTPEAKQVLLNMLRDTPGWRKLQMVGDMQETARMLMIAGLRQRHPHADETEIRRRFADMWLGKELAEEVYGPLPDGWEPTYDGTDLLRRVQ